MKKILLIISIILFQYFNLFSQSGTSCSVAEPFCTGVTYGFPMNTNTAAEVGPNYACLYTQPNPVWYYLLIDQPGDINIHIESPTGNDIDFIAWGPFPYPSYPCTGALTAGCTSCPNNTSDPYFYPSGNTIDCSYDPAPVETCHISNALTGQYYMLCITNYSNAAGNIVFAQTNSGQPGAGSTNCSCCLLNCIFSQMDTQSSQCDSTNNTFTLTGTITFSEIRDSGFVTITPPNGTPVIIQAPFDTTESFIIPGLIADEQYQNINFMYNNDPLCQATFSFIAPPPCISCYAYAGEDTSTCGLTYNLHSPSITGYSGHWSCDSAGVIIPSANSNNTAVQVPDYGYYTFIWTNVSPTNDTCSDSVTILFKRIPTSNFTVSPTTLLCEHDSLHVVYTGISSPTAQFNWLFVPAANILQGPTDNDFWINYPISGTKNIKLTITDNGCTSSISTVQKYIPAGYNLITTVGVSNCTVGSTQTVQVYASGPYPPFTYSWSNVTGPPFSAGTYTVTSTDTHGCKETSTFIVDTSAFSLTTNYQNLTCYNNSSGGITVTPNGGTQPYSYLWSNGATLNTLTSLSATNYTVTVTDQMGCTLIHALSLSQPSAITINKTITNVVCYNDCNGKITSSITGGTSPFTYLWNTGETTSIIDSLCPGLYNITVTDFNNCNAVQNNITVANHADMVITMPSSLSDCNGSCNGVASVTSVLNAYTPITYNWSNGSTGASQDSLCAGNYTVTIIDYKGCTKTATKTINATTGTVILSNTINDSVSCVTGCSGAISATASGGINPYTYHLGTISNTTGNFNNICPGNYSVWAADSNNCVSNSPFTIQGLPAVIANAGPDQTICSGAYTTLTATGGVSYVWSPSPAQQGIPFIYSSSRYYYVTVTDANGCTGTDNVLVTVQSQPVSNAGSDQTKCKDNNITSLSGSTNTVGEIWTGGSGVFSPNNTTVNATYTPTTTELSNGFVTLTLTTTTNGVCNSASDQMTILFANPPTVDAGIDQTKCANNPVISLAGNFTIATGVIWSGGVGTFLPNATTLNTTYTPTASEIASGTITLTITTTGNGVCSAKADQLTINFTPAPTAFAGIDTNICGNDPITLNGIITSATGGLWTGGNGTFNPNSSTLNATYTPTTTEISNGNVNLNLTTTGVGNCIASSDVITINFHPQINANAGSDITLCIGDSITLSATGGTNYIWNNSVIQGQAFTPVSTDIYTVTVSNSFGCTSSDSVYINVINPEINLTEYSDTLHSSGPYQQNSCLLQWYDSQGIITGATGEIFVPVYSSDFYVISDCNGCKDTSNIFSFIYTKTNELAMDKVFIYPNPTKDEITIENISIYKTIIITDESGKTLQVIENINKNKLNISLKNYSSGVYIIKLSTGNNITISKTIIKQ